MSGAILSQAQSRPPEWLGLTVAQAAGGLASMPIDLPPHGPDDLLIVMASTDGVATTVDVPEGWSALVQESGMQHGFLLAWARARQVAPTLTLVRSGAESGLIRSATVVAWRGAADLRPESVSSGAVTDWSPGPPPSATFPAGAISHDGLWICAGAIRTANVVDGPPGHTTRSTPTTGTAAYRHHWSDMALSGAPGPVSATLSADPLGVRTVRFPLHPA